MSAALLNRVLLRSFDTVVATSEFAREEFSSYEAEHVVKVPLAGVSQ